MNIKRNIISIFLIAPLALVTLFVPNQSVFAAQLSGGESGISSNWSGYVATAGNYTSVGASWIVPTVAATDSGLSADATWVGIGGLKTTDLIQAGTQAIVQNGTTSYQAWYELLPAASMQVPLVVHPGDVVMVSIAEQSAGEWNISFNDATTDQSYQTSVSYNSSLSSAEWIEEMPSDQRGIVSLDNFGTILFSNGFAVQNGSNVSIIDSGAQPMIMITNMDQALATPSVLGADGASFTVTRSATVASVPTVTRTGRWSRVGVGVQGYTPPTISRQPQTQTRVVGRSGTRSFRGGFGSLFVRFGNNTRFVFQYARRSVK